MTHIYVKSFNRPYYLERCLRSVRQFVRGDYEVIILDDGTPLEYLSKISALFPDITVRKSPQHKLKTDAIKNNTAPPYLIPSKFWHKQISNATPFFLLLEEDSWLTDFVDLNEITIIMNNQNLTMVKIGWNGAVEMVAGQKTQLSHSVEEFIPSIPKIPSWTLKLYFSNIFKVKSILNRLGIVTIKSLLPYYRLYTVTSAFFSREYWLALWDSAGNNVNEGHQLYRAVQWKKNNDAHYGKSINEKVKTSFITASDNRLRRVDFNMLQLNSQLNRVWLSGELDAYQNFPRDFTVDYLKSFLQEETRSKWDKWIVEFKTLYEVVGCEVNT